MGGKKKKTTMTQVTSRDPTAQRFADIEQAKQQQRFQPGISLRGAGVLQGSPFDVKVSTPEEAEAIRRLEGLTNIDALTKAARGEFEGIVKPGLEASLTAAGMGRSGAIGEAMTRAGTQMALPLTMEARGAQQNLAQYLGALGMGRLAPTPQTFQQAGSIYQRSKTMESPGALGWIGGLASAAGSLMGGGRTGGGGLGSLASGASSFLSGLGGSRLPSYMAFGQNPYANMWGQPWLRPSPWQGLAT